MLVQVLLLLLSLTQLLMRGPQRPQCWLAAKAAGGKVALLSCHEFQPHEPHCCP